MPPPGRPLVRRGLVAGAGVTAAAASLRLLTRPLNRDTPPRLLDWDLVRRIAHARTGETGPVGLATATARGAEYDALAAQMADRMRAVVGGAVDSYPRFDVVDRRGFVDANVAIVQRLFEPIETLRGTLPATRASALSRALLSRYVGELFGFLSRRVLGQYDPVLLLAEVAGPDAPRPALSLVEPNVAAFERVAGVDGTSLRRWLVLHELTHAWQFGAHPWLRDYIASLMREMLAGELVSKLSEATGSQAGGKPRLGLPDLIRGAVPAVRGQVRAVGRIQAVMSVAEGYGNFVMHRVGKDLPDMAELEAAFHRRSKRPLLEQLILALTGMRMKLRQYEIGERFADAVVARGGLDLLNRVWEGPHTLPTMAELREPGRWITRVSALS